MTTKNYTRTNL